MTVSIRTVLAATPTGEQGVPLSWEEIGEYLNAHCNQVADTKREERHKLRDALYRDGGVEYLCKVVENVYQDPDIRELLQKWAPFARFNNAIKRIINEVSTVYTAPAERHVGNKTSDVVYQAALEQLAWNEQMQEGSRLYNLHKTILIGIRVRVLADGTREPVLDIVTPSSFRVVLHPNDNKLVVGVLIRADFRSKRSLVRQPAWTLWTDHERVFLDEDMKPMISTLVEHGLDLNPWVVVSRAPTCAGFWPGEEGEDLVAGQVAIFFANMRLLKETKSATKVPVVSGDMAGAAHNQMADTDGQIVMPPDTSMVMHDMSMTPDQFTTPADHVLERLANNFGLSMALLTHQGVQSAEAREAMRIPLRELRRAQQPMFRTVERRLAIVLAKVLESDTDQSFDPEGWRIDFGEAQTPLSEREEVDLFLKKRGALLDDTVAYEIRKNPDLDDAAAWALIAKRILVETKRISEMRDMQAMSGGPSEGIGADKSEDGAAPQQMPPNDSMEGQAA